MVSGIKGPKYEPPEQISVENSNYDPAKARKLLDGTLEQRIINYAEINYGRGKEIAAELSKGNYRERGKDPFDVLDTICGHEEGEYWGEETPKSIDEVVKPSMLKVAAKGTLNLVNKTRWYYPILGALPGKYQEKIAEKFGDNQKHYTLSNMAVELVGSAALGYLAFGHLAYSAFFAIYSLMHSLIRDIARTTYKERAAGSVLCTLPFYATLYSILAVKAVKDAVIDSYSSVYKDQRASDVHNQPPKDLEVPKRIETPARIEEQPEIVMTDEGERFKNPEETRGLTGNPIVNWTLVRRDSKKTSD